MGTRLVVRLMFEWGGGCLWPGDDAARAAYGFGPIEDQLLLSPDTRRQLAEMSTWHDTSRDWDYAAFPQHPSPWPSAEWHRFERAVVEMQSVLRGELGESFDLVYCPL